MFKLADGRETLWQWDIDRHVIVEDPTIKEVHFSNRFDDCSLVVEVKDGLADIPNILLQDNRPIRVYGYRDGYTLVEQHITVKARTKPTDYVYTETEIHRWEDLQSKIDEVETGIPTAIEDYLSDNPPQVDLSNYYNKAETDTAINNAVNAIDIPTKVSELENDSGYLTQHQSLEGLATEEYVNDAIAAIPSTEESKVYHFDFSSFTENNAQAATDEMIEFAESTLAGKHSCAYVRLDRGSQSFSPTKVATDSSAVFLYNCFSGRAAWSSEITADIVIYKFNDSWMANVTNIVDYRLATKEYVDKAIEPVSTQVNANKAELMPHETRLHTLEARPIYDDAAKAKVDAIPEDPKYTDTVYDDTSIRQNINSTLGLIAQHTANTDIHITAEERTKWNNASGGAYVLPTASTDTLGGVKIDGSTITITDGVISAVGGSGGSSDSDVVFIRTYYSSNGTRMSVDEQVKILNAMAAGKSIIIYFQDITKKMFLYVTDYEYRPTADYSTLYAIGYHGGGAYKFYTTSNWGLDISNTPTSDINVSIYEQQEEESNEWKVAEGSNDSNLYNAKELFIQWRDSTNNRNHQTYLVLSHKSGYSDATLATWAWESIVLDSDAAINSPDLQYDGSSLIFSNCEYNIILYR